MLKRNIKAVIVAAFCLCLVLSWLTGCTGSPTETEMTADKTLTYTITLQTAGGQPIEKARVKIYTDAAKTQFADSGVTNDNGVMTFTGAADDEYFAVLEQLPGGYTGEQMHQLTGEDTLIIPAVGQMSEADFDNVTYSLGDAVMDFSVTAVDGTEYVLSELLEEKKAVVLNFWYLECSPCKAEFPYVQQVYEQFSGDVALIAMNPVNPEAEAVADFQEQNGYTFPMAVCDSRWGAVMNLTAYPTTVVIDRYGNICLIHCGMVTETEPLIRMFEYFGSEDYEQQFFKSMSQIPG